MATEPFSETQLKAGFVTNFLQFTQWPGNPRTIDVCGLAGGRPAPALDILEAVRLRSPAVSVKWVQDPAELTTCQVAFLEATQATYLAAVLNATARRPVLVVTDFESGVPLGATLGLVPTGGGRLGFDANLGVAKQAGLLLNARLLQLARRVY